MMFPKPSHARKHRKNRKQFTSKIIEQILERDSYNCIKCGSYLVEKTPHHITFKSQGGLGDVENGATVCRTCHTWAHMTKEGREWFENWRRIRYPNYEGEIT